MTYIKEYFKTLFQFLCLTGLLILLACAFTGSASAIYLVYLSTICAIVGPIGLAIRKPKDV